MNACLYIGTQDDRWCRKFLPEKAPQELPIAGKRWSRHAVDLCSQLAVSSIFIADCFLPDVEPARLPDGSYWGVELAYLPTRQCQNLKQLFSQHTQIPQNDDLLIFWGLVLPDITEPKSLLENLRPADLEAPILPSGVWLLRNGVLYECAVPLHRLDSLRHYFDLNFHFLEKPGVYTLPGYTAEPGVNIGQNVVIFPQSHITPPVVIHADSRLGRGLTISDGVIISRNVLVDNYTTLKHSIIMDNTYLGTNLLFQDKIVCHNRVIDVPSGAFVDLDLGFLTHALNTKKKDNLWIAEFVIALLLVVLLAPLFLLTYPLECWLGRVPFFKFFFRVYPRCFLVLVGHARLIRYGKSNMHYVFRFSDMLLLHRSEQRKEIDDLYYYHHHTLRAMLAVVLGSLFKRTIILTEPKEEEEPPEKDIQQPQEEPTP